MLHWMLLTLSTLMPSLEANIVGGCRLTGAILTLCWRRAGTPIILHSIVSECIAHDA